MTTIIIHSEFEESLIIDGDYSEFENQTESDLFGSDLLSKIYSEVDENDDVLDDTLRCPTKAIDELHDYITTLVEAGEDFRIIRLSI